MTGLRRVLWLMTSVSLIASMLLMLTAAFWTPNIDAAPAVGNGNARARAYSEVLSFSVVPDNGNANLSKVSAEVSKTANCATISGGMATVTGTITVKNVSGDNQTLRIVTAADTVYGKSGSSTSSLTTESIADLVGAEIADGKSLTVNYSITFNPGSYTNFLNTIEVTIENATTSVNRDKVFSYTTGFGLCSTPTTTKTTTTTPPTTTTTTTSTTTTEETTTTTTTTTEETTTTSTTTTVNEVSSTVATNTSTTEKTCPPIGGGINTTDATGKVNVNHYDSLADVYISGSPSQSVTSLEGQTIYFKITSPNGDVALTTVGQYTVPVGAGASGFKIKVLDYAQLTGTPNPNPAGEFKLYISTDPGFPAGPCTKSDNGQAGALTTTTSTTTGATTTDTTSTTMDTTTTTTTTTSPTTTDTTTTTTATTSPTETVTTNTTVTQPLTNQVSSTVATNPSTSTTAKTSTPPKKPTTPATTQVAGTTAGNTTSNVGVVTSVSGTTTSMPVSNVAPVTAVNPGGQAPVSDVAPVTGVNPGGQAPVSNVAPVTGVNPGGQAPISQVAPATAVIPATAPRTGDGFGAALAQQEAMRQLLWFGAILALLIAIASASGAILLPSSRKE